jgi:hypothetical protein
LLIIVEGNGLALLGAMLTSYQPSEIEDFVNVDVPLVPTNASLTQNNKNQNQKKTHLQNI